MQRGDTSGLRWPTYSGAVPLHKDRLSSALPTHLAQCLRGIHAWQVAVDGNRVTFASGMCPILTADSNVLNPFASGELEVDFATRQVRYRLSLAQLMIVASVLVGLVGVFTLFIMLLTPLPWTFIALAMTIQWIWLVGGNLLFGIPHFTTFLRRSISTAPMTSADG